MRNWLRQTGAGFGSGFGLGWGSAGSPHNALVTRSALLAPVADVDQKSIFTNEAGMLLIIKPLLFWNSSKAGMFMKTRGLFLQSRNVYENKFTYFFGGWRIALQTHRTKYVPQDGTVGKGAAAVIQLVDHRLAKADTNRSQEVFKMSRLRVWPRLPKARSYVQSITLVMC